VSHLKRQEVPKSWPIHRKGTTYVVRANSNMNNGIPILIILRDILKIAQNRKEVKRAIHDKSILVNTKPAREEKNSVVLFDTITIVPSKKNYVLELNEKGKFALKEIKESESLKKVAKIVDKKIMKGKKVQLNLSDGRNYLSDVKCKVNDSVVVNLKDKKIEKCLELKEKSKAFVFAGKHSGINGIIENLNLEGKIAKLKTKDGDVNVLIKQIMVVE